MASAIEGGVDAVILREKDLSCEELLPILQELKPITSAKGVPLIVNSNLEAAIKGDADGFHCSFPYFMENAPRFKNLVGVSVHSLEEAIEAERHGASYLLAGHVFETDCKADLRPRGLEFIREIKAHVSIPVIALGGINKHNAPETMNIGADGIAVMSGIMASKDPERSAMELKSSIMYKKSGGGL